MGLLAELRDSYQIKLNKDRIEAGLPPLKFDREETAWEKEQRIKQLFPVKLDPKTEVKILKIYTIKICIIYGLKEN